MKRDLYDETRFVRFNNSDSKEECITVALFGEIECVLYTLFRHSLRVYYGGVFWRDKEFIPNDTGEREVRLDCVFCSFVFVLCVCVGCECARERVRMCVCVGCLCARDRV